MNKTTQRDLADYLGINVSSVSRALKGDPQISVQLRERVTEAARELSYRPDPAVSALAHYRWEKRGGGKGLTLAFIADRTISVRPGFEDLKSTAVSMGYVLDPIEVDASVSSRSLLRVLKSRGVAGVLFHVDSSLSDALGEICSVYPAVNWNCRVDHPFCPGVLRDAYHRVSDCCEKLDERDVEHAVLVIPGTPGKLNEMARQMHAAWRFYQAERPGWADAIFYQGEDWKTMIAQVVAADPRVVVAGNEDVVRHLPLCGKELGRKLPFVCMDVAENRSHTGIRSTFQPVSKYCMDLIDRMIARRLTGREIAWIQVEVRGEWVDGESF